jgi:hypothetical protein
LDFVAERAILTEAQRESVVELAHQRAWTFPFVHYRATPSRTQNSFKEKQKLCLTLTDLLMEGATLVKIQAFT